MTVDQDPAPGHRLRAIFAEVFGLAESSVGPELSPENLDAWDSFGHMRLVMTIEQEFGVALTMEQITAIDSFAALEAVLRGAG